MRPTLGDFSYICTNSLNQMNKRLFFSITASALLASTMVQAQDGKILFLYEEDAFRHPETEPDDYYNIVFKKLCVKKITAGKYTL